MYLRSLPYYPTQGKGPELRPLLEQLTETRQGQGARAQLTTTVYGEDAPAFHITTQWGSLAALEKYHDDVLANAATSAIGPLLRMASSPTLVERLVDALVTPAPTKYIQRFVYRAAVGKTPELRAHLVERTKALQAQGRRATVSVHVFGATTGAFTLAIAMADLDELEQRRSSNVADPGVQAFNARLSELCPVPPSSDLRQVLVPYPPA